MIIGLTGGMACGKKTVLGFLDERGFIGFTFSDILKDILIENNMPVTRENQQNLGNEIRTKEGSGGLAKRLIAKMEPGKNYVIDGIRNLGEVNELRKLKDFYLIAIDVPQKLRFERIVARNMDRDPKTWDEFIKADTRDFNDGLSSGLQIDKCMEIADYTIMNDSTIDEFKERFEEIFNRIN
jgi:dephospho-CoA kinase